MHAHEIWEFGMAVHITWANLELNISIHSPFAVEAAGELKHRKHVQNNHPNQEYAGFLCVPCHSLAFACQ